MNSRWQDTPLAVLLRLLADLMIVNMLGLICSFGVVTAGAGLSAMYAVLFQRERDGGTVSAVKTFFHAFRKNFWQATLLEVIVAFAAAVAVVDFRFALGMEGALRNVYLLVGTVITAIALIVFIFSFAQQSTYRSSLRTCLKNSFLLAACAPGQLLLALAAWIVPWFLFFAYEEVITTFGAMYLMWGLAFPVYITVKLMAPVFAKTKQGE